jgi:hypothetical protein
MKEEDRMVVSENGVKRKTFVSKREVLKGDRDCTARIAYPYITRVIRTRRMRWMVHVERAGERSCSYRILVGKTDRKRPLGRQRRRWKCNVRIDLREIDL